MSSRHSTHASGQQRDALRSRRRALVPALALAMAAIVAGCGGDDMPEAPPGIAFELGREIEKSASREEVAERLESEPVLTAAASEEFAGGCDYYAISDQPLATAFEFCFDDQGELDEAGARFAPAEQPPPPDGASPARATLIGQGDATCDSDYKQLNGITNKVSTALARFVASESEANREGVGEAIADFVDNLEGTHGKLAAFEAPDDAAEALSGYLESLQQQIDVLSEARTAFLDEDLQAYNQRGDEFTGLGETAAAQALEYGFAYCSASDFG